MSKNLFNILFKKKGSLSREDISNYPLSSESKKYETESTAMSNDFNKDALEGWESMNYNIGLMKAMDAKFKPKKTPFKSIILTTTGLILITAVSILLLSKEDPIENNLVKPEQNISSNNEVLIDEEDIILSTEIAQMEIVPEKQQVTSQEISQEFVEIKKMLDAPNVNAPINPLKPKEVNLETEKIEISNLRISGKEISLNNLKLLDYRVYREKPEITAKQFVLTGTSANYETRDQEELEPEWQEVQMPYYDYIEKSARIFFKGNYKKALSRFETILKTYPDDINALFYGGLCYFNFGEYEDAIKSFEDCLLSEYSNFDQEVNWYYAQSLKENGQITKAKKILQSIIDKKGFYSEKAQSFLSDL